MADIYKQHEAAFASVAAFVITRDGTRVATVAFKFPRDGAGRLYAYVHWVGAEMVRGYDKKSAACAAAARRLTGPKEWDAELNNGFGGHSKKAKPMDPAQAAFTAELAKDDGYDWQHNLRSAGFEVWQAV